MDAIAILRVVKKIGDPLLDHIHREVGGEYEDVKAQVRELVRSGYLLGRCRRFSCNDWSYRLTPAGRRLVED